MIELPKSSSSHSRRQRQSIAEKIAIVKESFQPNVSIAAVALTHRINANLLHKWHWEYRNGKLDQYGNITSLIPVELSAQTLPEALSDVPAPSTAEPGYVEILIRESRVWVHGNVQASALREIFAALGS